MAKKQRVKLGRPTRMTTEVLTKLEQAFAIDASAVEACSYAGISQNTYYEYLKRNPSFQERVDELRLKPVLKARNTIVQSLTDSKDAQWYLERKRKNEFSLKQEVDITTQGEKLGFIVLPELNDSGK